tara:strand:+ start:4326 stop:4565 length:240 start_codon:yes stop_codon:yes gene_type:complete
MKMSKKLKHMSGKLKALVLLDVFFWALFIFVLLMGIKGLHLSGILGIDVVWWNWLVLPICGGTITTLVGLTIAKKEGIR